MICDSKTKIWTYWENKPGTDMPIYLKMCHEALVKMCASCEVILLTPDTLVNYLNEIPFDLNQIKTIDPKHNVIAIKSDYIRTALLFNYGGMWLDIDCVVLQDIGPVVRNALSIYDFYGVKKNNTTKIISNNFMASRKKGVIITEYLDTINKIIKNKLHKNIPFDWTEIGSKPLTKIVLNNKKLCFFEPEENVHPIHWKDADILHRKSDRNNINNFIKKDTKTVMLYNALFPDTIKLLTRRQILNSNSLIGELMRRCFPEQTLYYNKKPPNVNKNTTNHKLSDVEIIFTTIERIKSCINFVDSIRNILGKEPKISIAIQDNNNGLYDKLIHKYKCNLYFVGKDAGISSSRNTLIENSTKPIIFLCDDDFVFDERIKLKLALDVLNNRPDIGVLGGLFENYYYNKKNKPSRKPIPTAFNNLFWVDNNILKYVPTEYIELQREFIDHHYFLQQLDTVNNFALFRREIFTELNLAWDSKCKIMGEHEIFYMDYKNKTPSSYAIYYTNLLITQHHRIHNDNYILLRNRFDGMIHLLTKMNLNKIIYFGKRVEILQQDGNLYRADFTNWDRQ